MLVSDLFCEALKFKRNDFKILLCNTSRNLLPISKKVTFLYFHRLMYWTDWGSSPKIEKADMSGKQRAVLVSSSLYWPNGLTLYKEKNRLYWVDASYDKLEYLDLNNNNRVTLISSSSVLPHPFGLTLLGDHLYWTDWTRDAVYRANKENGGDVTAFITGLGQPMDIHGYNLSEHTTPGT